MFSAPEKEGQNWCKSLGIIEPPAGEGVHVCKCHFLPSQFLRVSTNFNKAEIRLMPRVTPFNEEDLKKRKAAIAAGVRTPVIDCKLDDPLRAVVKALDSDLQNWKNTQANQPQVTGPQFPADAWDMPPITITKPITTKSLMELSLIHSGLIPPAVNQDDPQIVIQKIKELGLPESVSSATKAVTPKAHVTCMAEGCDCFFKALHPQSCLMFTAHKDMVSEWTAAIPIEKSLTGDVRVCKCHFHKSDIDQEGYLHPLAIPVTNPNDEESAAERLMLRGKRARHACVVCNCGRYNEQGLVDSCFFYTTSSKVRAEKWRASLKLAPRAVYNICKCHFNYWDVDVNGRLNMQAVPVLNPDRGGPPSSPFGGAKDPRRENRPPNLNEHPKFVPRGHKARSLIQAWKEAVAGTKRPSSSDLMTVAAKRFARQKSPAKVGRIRTGPIEKHTCQANDCSHHYQRDDPTSCILFTKRGDWGDKWKDSLNIDAKKQYYICKCHFNNSDIDVNGRLSLLAIPVLNPDHTGPHAAPFTGRHASWRGADPLSQKEKDARPDRIRIGTKTKIPCMANNCDHYNQRGDEESCILYTTRNERGRMWMESLGMKRRMQYYVCKCHFNNSDIDVNGRLSLLAIPVLNPDHSGPHAAPFPKLHNTWSWGSGDAAPDATAAAPVLPIATRSVPRTTTIEVIPEPESPSKKATGSASDPITCDEDDEDENENIQQQASDSHPQEQQPYPQQRVRRHVCAVRCCPCYQKSNDPSPCKVYHCRSEQGPEWCKALNLKPQKKVTVCKCHFKPDQFRISSYGERTYPLLKNDAVPYLRIVDHVAQATAFVPALQEENKRLKEELSIIKSFFSENQIRVMFGHSVSKWTDEELALAHKLRNKTSRAGYEMFKKYFPLPTLTTLDTSNAAKRQRTDGENGESGTTTNSVHEEEDLNAIIASMYN
jgi:hypothetical protein